MTRSPSTGSSATDEQFVARLAAVDPVDRSTLPDAGSPEATRLLDGILADEGGAADRFAAGPDRGVPAAAPPTAVAGRRRFGLVDRGRGALVAVAAAVALLVGTVTILAPDNTPAAVAEVRAAAAATADADSGVITTDFSLRYSDASETETVGGRFEARYDGADLGLSIQLDDAPADLDGAEIDRLLPALADIRLVDDVLYVQDGGQWMSVDTDGLLGGLVVGYVDPRTVLDTVQTLSEATENGSAEVDGVATTRYRSVIDLGDDTLSQSGWLAFEGMDIEAEGEVTIDLYVDEAGNLRRLDLSGDVRPAAGVEAPEDARGVFEVTTIFSGLDADVTIEAPDGAVAFDPLAGAFDE